MYFPYLHYEIQLFKEEFFDMKIDCIITASFVQRKSFIHFWLQYFLGPQTLTSAAVFQVFYIRNYVFGCFQYEESVMKVQKLQNM